MPSFIGYQLEIVSKPECLRFESALRFLCYMPSCAGTCAQGKCPLAVSGILCRLMLLVCPFFFSRLFQRYVVSVVEREKEMNDRIFLRYGFDFTLSQTMWCGVVLSKLASLVDTWRMRPFKWYGLMLWSTIQWSI